MRKTLGKFLQSFEEHEIVAIATKNGSSFIYIGEAGNRELIEKIFDDYLEAQERERIVLVERVKDIVNNPPKTYGKDCVDEKDALQYAYLLSRAYSRYEKINDYINGYAQVMKRDVIDSYHKDVDNCMAIVINGYECGDFWLKSEFDKKYFK